MKYRTIFLLVLSFATLGHVVFADGLGHIGDRYIGPKVVLTLTPRQIQHVLAFERKKSRKWHPAPWWMGTNITLTPEQKVTLIKRTGFSPSVLNVRSPRAAFNDNACFIWNIGIHFQTDQIDVPVNNENFLSDSGIKQRRALWAIRPWWHFW